VIKCGVKGGDSSLTLRMTRMVVFVIRQRSEGSPFLMSFEKKRNKTEIFRLAAE